MPRTIDPHYRFAIWRKYRGLTLQEVGDCIGKTKQLIAVFEVGEKDLGVRRLQQICHKAFKIDLETFFGPLPKTTEAA